VEGDDEQAFGEVFGESKEGKYTLRVGESGYQRNTVKFQGNEVRLLFV